MTDRDRLGRAFYIQKVRVGRSLVGLSRLAVIGRVCRGRDVLHVGCADWPTMTLQTSLHLALDPICRRLDGLDVRTEALDLLRPHASGRLFDRRADITGAYDTVIVPEVLEHVGDMAGFLANVASLNAKRFLFTVPDAFSCAKKRFAYDAPSTTFTEIVHPDHDCWFSPYTFAAVIRKYTPLRLRGMWFFNGTSLLGLFTKSRPAA